MNVLIEIIGWIGAVLIVGAYCLNMYGYWKSGSPLYIGCNLIGGFFFVINTFVHKAYPSMIVNIIWVFIAVAAIFKKSKPA
jgi:hypothetical protein